MELKDIERLAKLSRISLTEDEKSGFLNDFKSILGYVEQIKEVVTDEKPREFGELRNVMREDKVYDEKLAEPSEILDDAPKRSGDYIKVEQMF